MKGPPFLKTFDIEKANKIAAERMGQIGIDVRDPSQAVGTMSGGERQCLAISRAIYFGAKVLVLDEPTSALGVHQASVVLKYIVKAASQGLAVILITHTSALALHFNFTKKTSSFINVTCVFPHVK